MNWQTFNTQNGILCDWQRNAIEYITEYLTVEEKNFPTADKPVMS